MGWDEIRQARRRLSQEQGTIIKDWGGRVPVALIYPNSYYVGMSNLAIQAIYGLLNSRREVVAERVFWERGSQAQQRTPLSLESQRPLSDFAALVFSISYEVDYFNVVQIINASGIPLYTADRDERYPLVIAGGPCIMANPMPLAPFFDCLCIGEAEPILPGMLAVLTEGIGGRRHELLKGLAALPGVYVPQDYSGTPVARQWAVNLDDFPTTSTVLTMDTELGDLYLIEVERGCHWGCRFCLVGGIFNPGRFRSVDSLIAQAKQGLRHRKRLGLVGPAVFDHPRLEELLSRLRRLGAGLATSSLRVKPFSGPALEELVSGGAQTVSLGVEAGSQRLRQMIKKGITEDDILSAVSKVAQQGIRSLKLYFMIGLPSETDSDIREIIELMLRAKQTIDRYRSGTRLTLNVAPFVPKAHTPFQWLPMAPVAVLNERLALLKSLQSGGIKIRAESPSWSEVQAVLSRGDVNLAEVLASVDEVSLPGWRRAMSRCQLDSDFYAHQQWDVRQRLPWEVIDSGIKPGYLEAELARALA
ncbi:MAG: radical SAM protein [Dehalococcoidales bacterium]|nr:radical SAM protein [Dehalococcoidales bacterium]